MGKTYRQHLAKECVTYLSEFLHPLCYYIHPCLFESIIYVL